MTRRLSHHLTHHQAKRPKHHPLDHLGHRPDHAPARDLNHNYLWHRHLYHRMTHYRSMGRYKVPQSLTYSTLLPLLLNPSLTPR